MSDISSVSQLIETMGGIQETATKMTRIMGRRMPYNTVKTWRNNQDIPYPWDRIIRWHADKLGVPTNPLPECLRSGAIE